MRLKDFEVDLLVKFLLSVHSDEVLADNYFRFHCSKINHYFSQTDSNLIALWLTLPLPHL